MSRWPRRRPLFSAAPVMRPPAKKWRWRYVAWAALKRTCMAIGAMVLFSALFSCALVASVSQQTKTAIGLPDKMVLYMPLEGDYAQHHDVKYSNADPTLREVSEALDAARADKRVQGVVASLRGGVFSLSQLYELRVAIKRFRESGKFAYFYTGSFDEQGQGLGSYYLASAFDEIWMQPVGALSIGGIKAEVPYARDMLAKLGVTPDFFARKEYKDVFSSFTADGMSAPSREMLTAIVGDIAGHIRDEVAADRGMAAAQLQALIDKGLLTDRESKDSGLIDVIDYGDRLTDRIKKDVTGDADSEDLKFVEIGHYVRQHSARAVEKALAAGRKPRVALIYAVGTIVSKSETSSAAGPSAFMGGGVISAADLGLTINDVIDDDEIDVIVLRIDSPGGSPVASETLRGKIVRAQEKGKKIVVSMGENAASGGYWMVAPADYIFAAPLTMTGSIGVAGGKFVLADMWNKIGINWDGVKWGENAGMNSMNEVFSDGARARYDALMDSIYAEFVKRVAEGRDMTPAQADELARGRVWTGLQAQKRGLVDEIGGLDAALDHAAKLAGAPDRHGIALEVLPEPVGAFEHLINMLEMQSSAGRWLSSLAGTAQMARQADDFMVYETLRVR